MQKKQVWFIHLRKFLSSKEEKNNNTFQDDLLISYQIVRLDG